MRICRRPGVTRRQVLRGAAALGAGSVLPLNGALAQAAYPSRAIQMVVPYPPGGSDAVPRKLAVGLGERLGQPVVVVNKPGASTQIASAMVATAAPDGYMLYMANPAELAAGAALFKALPFNALTDLTPITYVADAPFTLLASTKLAAKTLPELIAVLKAAKQPLRFGSYGVQTQPDILARRFNALAGTTAEIIPYQGGSPAFNALVRDEVQLVFATLIPTRAFIANGQMTAIAVAATERLALMPQLPTLREQGFDIVDQAAFGLMGPKALPAPIVARVNDAVAAELADAGTRKFIEEMGVIVRGLPSAAFAQQLATQTREWADLVPRLGLQVQ